jgi:hypothetical protein
MGRRTNFSYDEILTMRKKNIGGVVHQIKTKAGYSDYGDVLLSIFSNGLYTQIRSQNVALDVSQQIRNLVFNSSNPTAYFAALDAITQTGPNAIVSVIDANLDIYYNLPGTATINILSGTQFVNEEFLVFAAGTYLLIPSTYPIFITGYSYQTFGTSTNATLRITSPTGVIQNITVGNNFTIGLQTYKFLLGGSPGLIELLSCPSYDIIDGGLNTATPNIIIDGGTLGQLVACFIDGGTV